MSTLRDRNARNTVVIGDRAATIDDLVAIARRGAAVKLGPAATQRMKAARAVVDRLAAGDKPIYGLNTGLGAGVDKAISSGDECISSSGAGGAFRRDRAASLD